MIRGDATQISHQPGDTSRGKWTNEAGDVADKLDELATRAGPISSTDNAIARYDGTAGALQDSGVLIDDANILRVPGGTIYMGAAGTAASLSGTAAIVGLRADSGAATLYLSSTALSLSGVPLDLNGQAIGSAGDVGCDSLTKDGAGDIAVNDNLDLVGNNLVNVGDVECDSLTKDGAGNITLNSNITPAAAQTFDGRDVSVDGAKLDLIEAAADVTDEVNVRAALAALTADAVINENIRLAQSKALYLDTDLDSWVYCSVDDVMGIATGNIDRIVITNAAITFVLPLNMGANAITTASTVDGRDLSVDGAKLDLIEALADVTDAANVDAAGAVMEADFNAKGDLLSATADDTPSILSVGSDGECLICDSGEATGLKYAGQLCVLTFGYPSASSANSHVIPPTYNAYSDDSTKRMYKVPWAGTIVAACFTTDINAYTSGTIRGDIYVNGVAQVTSLSIVGPGVGNGYSVYSTALSVALAAGDYISCARQLVAPVGITTDDPNMQVYIRLKAT